MCVVCLLSAADRSVNIYLTSPRQPIAACARWWWWPRVCARPPPTTRGRRGKRSRSEKMSVLPIDRIVIIIVCTIAYEERNEKMPRDSAAFFSLLSTRSRRRSCFVMTFDLPSFSPYNVHACTNCFYKLEETCARARKGRFYRHDRRADRFLNAVD